MAVHGLARDHRVLDRPAPRGHHLALLVIGHPLTGADALVQRVRAHAEQPLPRAVHQEDGALEIGQGHALLQDVEGGPLEGLHVEPRTLGRTPPLLQRIEIGGQDLR